MCEAGQWCSRLSSVGIATVVVVAAAAVCVRERSYCTAQCCVAHMLGSYFSCPRITYSSCLARTQAVELPLTHPELYEDIGIKPPKVSEHVDENKCVFVGGGCREAGGS